MRCRRLWCVAIVGMIGALHPLHAGAVDSPPKWSVPTLGGVTVKGLPPVTSHIHVDQFGYLPDEHKVAVLSDPRRGLQRRRSFHARTAPRGSPGRGRRGRFRGAPALFDGGNSTLSRGTAAGGSISALSINPGNTTSSTRNRAYVRPYSGSGAEFTRACCARPCGCSITSARPRPTRRRGPWRPGRMGRRSCRTGRRAPSAPRTIPPPPAT